MNLNDVVSYWFPDNTSDGADESSATVTQNGNGTNSTHVLNDGASVQHDSTLDAGGAGVLANDTDPSGLTMSAVLVQNVSHGTLNLASNGSFAYTPTPGYTGNDSFTYHATDGSNTSNTATVSLTVTNTGLPATVADSYSVQHDQVLTEDASAGVLANDSDSDNDSLTASLVSGQGPSHGTLTLNKDGSFTYTPSAGYVGSDSFQYTASDGIATSAATTVTITVTNTTPTAVAHSYGIPENTSESVTAASALLNGASDSDGDTLTASLVSGASHGSVTVNSDGSFTYTPTTGYTGTDSFQYKVSDGASSSTATVTLTVHGTDTAPTVSNPPSYSVPHDQVLTATATQGVLSSVSDADNDPLTASLVSGSGPSHGTLTLNPDGSFTYTPTAGYTGSDSFQYKASDGLLTSSAATVTLTVTNTGAPVANADSYSVERNNAFTADASIGVLANDTDSDGDTLTASLVSGSGPSHGSLTFNSDGSFSYTPTTGYTGSDTFQYTASDGVATSSAATVTLTVSASPPVANNDSYNVQENTALVVPANGVLGNDTDPDNLSLTAVDVTLPSHGSLSLNSNGGFTYTPNTGYTGPDSFTYEASDGSLLSAAATVSLTVKASDTAPMAQNVSYTLAHDTSLSTDSSSGVLSGASDSDNDPLLAVLVSNVTHGTLTLNLDGSFVYTPNAGYYGTDSFTFKVFDGTSYSSVATASLTVTNDAPTAVNDSYSVLASGMTTVSAANGVLANDTDGENDSLTASDVTLPAHGTLTLNTDGSFSYTPGSGFTGTDSFTYKAYDGVNYSNVATVSLTTAPVAAAQTYEVHHDTALSVDATDGLLNGATDADGDHLTAALVSGSGPSHGNVTVNSDGSFTYTPNAGYTGTDSFSFTASDGTQTSAAATVTINVTDDTPVANPVGYNTPENQALVVNAATGVLATAADDDGDAVTSQLVSGPSNGILQFGTNGAFTYTPNTGFYGTDSFTFDATDGISTSAPATVTITVDQEVTENYPSSQPSAVAVADFNGDGNPDVALADQGLNTVSVYLDNSSGQVATTPISITTVGTAPVALAAGDFNGDGKQDLAVANSGSNTVSILLGNGDGTFTTGTTLTGFNDPVALVVGEFDGDTKPDLAVVNKGSNTVSILLGNGNGTFTAGTSLTTGSSPTSIAAADFNGDGKTDLVVTNSASNTVSVFLGNGNGTFQTALTDAVGTTPSSVTTADFNGDGKVDLAVANSGSNNVSVLLGNGDGTFQAPTNYAVGSDPVSIAAGDLNGQGSPDLAVVNKGSGTVSDLLNLGGGTFIGAVNEVAATQPAAVALSDLVPGDGVLDQVVALSDPGFTVILKPANLRVAISPQTISTSFDASFVAWGAQGDTTVRVIKTNVLPWTSSDVQVKSGGVIQKIGSLAICPVNPRAAPPGVNPFRMALGVPGGVATFDLSTGGQRGTLSLPAGVPAGVTPTQLSFSPKGDFLVGSLGDAGGVLWNLLPLTQGKPAPAFRLQAVGDAGVDGPIQRIIATEDPMDGAQGVTIIASSGSTVGTWTFNTGTNTLTPQASIKTPDKDYKSISALGNMVSGGSFLAVGYVNGYTVLYQRQANGAIVAKYKAINEMEKTGQILGLPFNSALGGFVRTDMNGITILKYDGNKTLQGVAAESRTLAELGVAPNKLLSVAVTNDQKRVIIGATNGRVTAFPVNGTPPAINTSTPSNFQKGN